MRPKAITTLGGRFSAQVAMWCCSSKAIPRSPARIWNSFLRTPRPIGAPGSRLSRSRKAMVVWSGVTSLPVLIEIDYLRRDWGEVGQVFREAPRTHHQRPAQRRGGLWLDQSVVEALFPSTALAGDSRALGRGKSAPLAPRCDFRGGSLWRPLPAGGSNARRPQHRGALLDGLASGSECSLVKSAASSLTLTRPSPGSVDPDRDF